VSEAAQALLGGSAASTTSIPGSACCLGRQAELCGFPDYSYRALNQGKCEQARAEKRDTDSGKGQEATRNKVVIAHGAVLDCTKEAIQPPLLSRPTIIFVQIRCKIPPLLG